MSFLSIVNGSKVYDTGFVRTEALKNVTLHIAKGEFLVILGPSGSGKSTLLNVLSGLDTLTKGDIYLNDENYKNYDDTKMSEFRRTKFGFIFQSFMLLPTFTVYENIITPLMLHQGMKDKEYVQSLIKMLGLEEQTAKFPNQLSGGQQQRVAIARALVNKPNVVFADEPTGNLDSKTGKEVIELLLQGVKAYGNTLVMVTHNESFTSLASRVIRVNNGMVEEEEQG